MMTHDDINTEPENNLIDDSEFNNGWILGLDVIYAKMWDREVPKVTHLDCRMHLLFRGSVAYIVKVLHQFW